MPKVLTLLSALVLAACLTSCSAPEPPRLMVETRVERIQIPGELLSCAQDPEVPHDRRESVVALYLARLWQAGEDCRGKLAAVKALAEK